MIMNVNLSEDEKQKLVEFRKKYYRNYFLLQLYLKSSLKKYEKKYKKLLIFSLFGLVRSISRNLRHFFRVGFFIFRARKVTS